MLKLASILIVAASIALSAPAQEEPLPLPTGPFPRVVPLPTPPKPVLTNCVMVLADDPAWGWRVTCSITLYGQKVWDKPLVLAMPATFDEAVAAVKRFREQEVPRLLKRWGYERRRKDE